MAFSINQFTATLNKGSTAKISNFECLITRANGKNTSSTSNTLSNERDIMFRVDRCHIPGRQVITYDQVIYGPATNIAYVSGVPTEMNLGIILSEDYREKEYFEKWIDDIIGNYRVNSDSSDRYDIGFYNDYIGNLKIYTFDDTGYETYVIECREAYPVNIGDVNLDWSNGNEIARLDVNIRFKHYSENKGNA